MDQAPNAPPLSPSTVISQPNLVTPQRSNQKFLFIFGAISLLLGGIVGGFFLAKSPLVDLFPMRPSGVACTKEARICPDGSSVGRTGPKCEFTPCPQVTTTFPSITPDPTANWKTYLNQKYGYSIQYPDLYEMPMEEGAGDYLSLAFLFRKVREKDRDNRIIIGVSEKSLEEEVDLEIRSLQDAENFVVVENKELLVDGIRRLIRVQFLLKATAVEPAKRIDYTTLYIQTSLYTYFIGVDSDIASQILPTFKFL